MKRVNGEVSGMISAADRGLLYGDGVFETMRCVAGDIPLLDLHFARLDKGLARLGIPQPATDMRAAALQCATERGNGIVKLIVTRGEGGRGYRPPETTVATLVVEDFPLPRWPIEWFDSGVRIRTCATRLASDDPLAGLKTLNRLPQVLARREWNDPGIAEGIMLDGNAQVIEGTMSNVFYRLDECWYTPPINTGVRGVMRTLLREELGIEERVLPFEERDGIESMFVCNSVFGIWPVRRWDDLQLASGTMPDEFRMIPQRYFEE